MLTTRFRWVYLAIAVTGLSVLAGCGSSSNPESSSSTTTAPTSSAPTTASKGLAPAGSIEARRQAAKAQIVTFGQPGKLPGDVYVIFNAPLTVVVTIQALGSSHRSGSKTVDPPINPCRISGLCAWAAPTWGYQAGSTVSLTDMVPGGSYREGNLNLLLPKDSRTGTPVPACATPAYVQAIPNLTDITTKPVRVQIPDATIASLNAKRHA